MVYMACKIWGHRDDGETQPRSLPSPTVFRQPVRPELPHTTAARATGALRASSTCKKGTKSWSASSLEKGCNHSAPANPEEGMSFSGAGGVLAAWEPQQCSHLELQTCPANHFPGSATPRLHPSQRQMSRCRRCHFLSALLLHCHPPAEPQKSAWGAWWAAPHTRAAVKRHSGALWEFTSLFQKDPADPQPHSPSNPQRWGWLLPSHKLLPEQDRVLFGMLSVMPPSTVGELSVHHHLSKATYTQSTRLQNTISSSFE